MPGFIDMLLRGGQPTTKDFLMKNRMSKPGLQLPPQVAPQQPKPGLEDRANQLLDNPFLLNLLAQSGYSTMPQSPFGAIGKAALGAQQYKQQQSESDLKKQLLESQIGLNKYKASQAGGGQRVVQSAQPLANGNIGYLDAFTGKVVDTGQKAGGKGQVIDLPGIGQTIYDPIQGSLTQVNPEEVLRTGQAGRAGAIESAKQGAITQAIPEQVSTRSEAEDLAKARISGPNELAKTDAYIQQGREFVGQLKSGELNTGPIVGRFPAVSTNSQLFEAWSGEQVLQKISEATFGALSEGERAFLASTVSGRDKTEEANMQLIEKKLDLLEEANNRVRQKIGAPAQEKTRRKYNPVTGKIE